MLHALPLVLLVPQRRVRTLLPPAARKALNRNIFATMHAGNAAPDNAAVVAVRQLVIAADHASDLGRMSRAIELYERALAAVEANASLRGSLALPVLLHNTVHVYGKDASSRLCKRSSPSAAVMTAEALNEAVFCSTISANGTTMLSLSQRSLALFRARWSAGTLLALTPQEAAFFGGSVCEAQLYVVRLYISCADDAAGEWPPLRSPAEDAARMNGIYGALRVALEAEAQGLTLVNDASSDDKRRDARILFKLLRVALADDMLRQLRATCGLACNEEAALWQLAQRADACINETLEELLESTENMLAARRERAAADVARHGLRRCALPECGAMEPHPKAFKLCGRCRRGVVYCSAAHQQADWRRHKRNDGCKAAA